MEEVPEHLLLEILRRIDDTADRNSTSLVCKRFHSAEGEQRGSLRTGCGLHPATEALASLCTRFPNLSKLEIDYSGWMSHLGKQLDDRGLLVLPSHCPLLEDLTLSFCSFITDAGLGHLSSCRNLRSLKLNFAPSISSNGLLTVVVGCKKLSTLHLSRCMKVKSSEWLEYLGKFGVLEDLTIRNCRAIGEADVMRLGSGWRRLRRLELEVDANYRDLKTHNQLPANRQLIQHIVCDSLEELRLVNCAFPYRVGLSCVLGSCKMLEKLCLDRCCGLMDRDMIALALGSSNLRCLSLYLPSHFDAPGMMSIYPPQLTDDSLRALACSCPTLVEVAISLSDPVLPSISSFSQSGILTLIRSCPVRVLVLNRAYMFDDRGMEDLTSCNFLEKLELISCQEVSDEGMQLVGYIPRLSSLTLCKCLGITDFGLKPLLSLKKLESLTVHDCPQISEEGVQGAARSVSYRQDLSWLY
uniref:F-box/LRR-repeat protein 14 n=1 Tax=Anthurium amnicola TaxID=1678845 RepID=A0A1D1ZGE1_9ARAE